MKRTVLCHVELKVEEEGRMNGSIVKGEDVDVTIVFNASRFGRGMDAS